MIVYRLLKYEGEPEQMKRQFEGNYIKAGKPFNGMVLITEVETVTEDLPCKISLVRE